MSLKYSVNMLFLILHCKGSSVVTLWQGWGGRRLLSLYYLEIRALCSSLFIILVSVWRWLILAIIWQPVAIRKTVFWNFLIFSSWYQKVRKTYWPTNGFERCHQRFLEFAPKYCRRALSTLLRDWSLAVTCFAWLSTSPPTYFVIFGCYVKHNSSVYVFVWLNQSKIGSIFTWTSKQKTFIWKVGHGQFYRYSTSIFNTYLLLINWCFKRWNKFLRNNFYALKMLTLFVFFTHRIYRLLSYSINVLNRCGLWILEMNYVNR